SQGGGGRVIFATPSSTDAFQRLAWGNGFATARTWRKAARIWAMRAARLSTAAGIGGMYRRQVSAAGIGGRHRRQASAASIGGQHRRQVNGHTWGVLAGNSVFLDSYRKRRYTRFLYEKYPQYFIDHHA
ncbi:MAG: hypothetical protein WBI41_12930, partial [Azovibrio sp.]|uniref:hypothetical protein n=1 Tax=Azovibrio sp. TaxID=1872673 RepID=UPI003C74241D